MSLKRCYLAILMLALTGSVTGCHKATLHGGEKDTSEEDSNPKALPDSDNNLLEPDSTDPESDFGDDCDEPIIGLERVGTKVMLLVDFSGSMNDDRKWESTTQSISKVVNNPANKEIQFGFDVFPNPNSSSPIDDNPECCDLAREPIISIGFDRGDEIDAWMNTHQPTDLNATPLVAVFESYLNGRDTALRDDKTSNYLIVISDGPDSCYSRESVVLPFPSNAKNMLRGLADNLKEVSGTKTVAIGLGDIDSTSTMQLNALAGNGGTIFENVIPVKDGPALEIALKEIVASIKSCEYRITSKIDKLSQSKTRLFVDGKAVPRDNTHRNGWDLIGNTELKIEFFGEYCEQIRTGDIKEVIATSGCGGPAGFSCAGQDGILPFPPKAVVFVLDGGYFPVISNDATLVDPITNMIVSDFNRQMQYGLYLLPPESAHDSTACFINDTPEVPLGGATSGMEIIKWLTTHTGYPSTEPEYKPLFVTLELLLNRPNGIDIEDTSPAIVVMSDGNQACSGTTNDMTNEFSHVTEAIVEKLGARVYVIGYPDGNAHTLNAIAQAGNTGRNDYVQIEKEGALDETLQEILRSVPSCTLKVPYVGDDVDYDGVRFLFDWERVPMDLSRQDGWDWQNDLTKSAAVFFGKWCDMLKRGGVTEVFIEYSCVAL